MTSRAHAAHHYSFGGAAARPRREVQLYRDDPIVLPRSSNWDVTSALMVAAVAAIGIVGSTAYTLLHSEPRPLAETPTLALTPLTRDLASDAELTSAHVLKALNGPAFAVPSLARPESVSDENALAPSATPEARHDDSIDDSAPGAQPRFPQTAPRPPLEAPYPEPARPPDSDPAAAPYPNPTTTPPEGVAPPNTSPQTPTPALDPENPYR